VPIAKHHRLLPAALDNFGIAPFLLELKQVLILIDAKNRWILQMHFINITYTAVYQHQPSQLRNSTHLTEF